MIGGRLVAIVLSLAAGMALVACGGPAASAPGTASAPGAVTATAAVAPASPVIGKVIAVDLEGLSKVKGFTVRMDDGLELAFVIGSLENGAEFPPGHLAEHLATASPVRVFFREAGGARVVYRIEDAG